MMFIIPSLVSALKAMFVVSLALVPCVLFGSDTNLFSAETGKTEKPVDI